MDTDDAIRSINESFERIAMGARRSVRRSAADLAADLPPSAWPVFREVLRAGRIQASTIIASLAMDKSAVSRHLKELREHGLVDAERDEHDARSVWVRPTPLALERSAAILADQQERLREQLAAWEPGELDRFARLLDRFAAMVPPTAAGKDAGMDERQRDDGPDDHERTVPGEERTEPPEPPEPDAERADAASAPAAQPRDGGHDVAT